jgi:sulfite reductase (NADPH) flavoprotein alpha-component
MIAALAPLQPRLYSISSSLKAHPEEVHLTVGVVRYTKNDRVRKGVASTFLTETLRTRQKVGVFVHTSAGFRLPADGATPIIMVGPGTGIAPFRAFLEERAATGAKGKNWLFFGDQHREFDFLYRVAIEAYAAKGVLTRLDLAFSRDQKEKVYVQHRMRENAKELWAWLQEGAHFYVCGDARRMALDVDHALHAIVAEQGGMSPAAAGEYVKALTKAKRYQRDVY